MERSHLQETVKGMNITIEGDKLLASFFFYCLIKIDIIGAVALLHIIALFSL